ncbi:cellulose biosynthesis protein BcsQ [Rhizobium skierniewicense]|uniref:Cellulose biosynthesis protein BcsQ n=1 Tax=Rhizobium skierniewicense TaxID=984260 RepID=A0A7W6CCE5_9HYPH|nr:hypothetical protein [Rhizobium skierniewicense]MBB3947833.1 cellulose biosynthesis protein BcsQ [Rhizobium skierniewicense]
MNNEQLPLTWIDVARRLAAIELADNPLPSQIITARAGWFGLLLEHTGSLGTEEVEIALDELFPSRVKSDPLRIELEGGSDLHVHLEPVDGESGTKPPFGVVDGIIDFRTPAAVSSSRKVPIAAALSVKGGTGRTTTAVAFALHWAAAEGKPVLLVDADLEAPGISYLFESFVGQAKIALEDLIALAHSEEKVGAPETVNLVSERLKDHAVPGNLFILPLRRNIVELASSSIRAEHLSTPERPFALADLLADVAEKIGAVGVVVDVRAGLVPLGVNLAMDPDVSPIIVTSLAEQSIRATAGFVSFLSREFRRAQISPRRPLIVVNRVPSLFKQTGMDKKLIEPLTDQLIETFVQDDETELTASDDYFTSEVAVAPYVQVEVPELPDMQIPMGGWREFVAQLEVSGFMRALASGSDEFLSSELSVVQTNSQVQTNEVTITSQRRDLAKFANQLIAAENLTGAVPKPLVTQPLSELASRFKSEVPIAVIEGAKGTGKTLAARYIVSKQDWRTVVNDLVGTDSISAQVVPVTMSVQSSNSLQSEVDDARSRVSVALGLTAPMSIYETTTFLKDKLQENLSESQWVAILLDLIAWSIGLKPRVRGAGESLLQELRANGKSVIAVFEGLEELYKSVSDPGVEVAMRSALISLPQKLRSELRRPLGLLMFVRRDTVEAAVTQNLDQFSREYQQFAFRWTEDDVLELAAWLATQSGALPGLWNPTFQAMTTNERAKALHRLWGAKLGPDDRPGKRTREAYTSTWIIAVLSDLRGRLVPRDLVRLLANAAAEEPEAEDLDLYGNRLLVPRALRAAVDPTSGAKVSETVEEIVELKPAFEKFKSQTDELSVPLTDEAITSLDLSAAEVSSLRRHGIIFGEKAPYQVPELFRRGLGLRHSGARRSVVALYNRARKLP